MGCAVLQHDLVLHPWREHCPRHAGGASARRGWGEHASGCTDPHFALQDFGCARHASFDLASSEPRSPCVALL
eukprot:1214757-Pleurochrysis_carterae.AAC.1